MNKRTFVLAGVLFCANFIPNLVSASIISTAAARPLAVQIPSINLYSPVQGVGVTPDGKMDVPSGKTNLIGWYKYGVRPGNVGTAVLDAHNTAAFKNLEDVPVGGDIYVLNEKGEKLHFVVTKKKVYEAKTTSPKVLFAQTNSRQINLITCAGELLGNGEATHRLIVSAKLV